jgi:hypothetical protein
LPFYIFLTFLLLVDHCLDIGGHCGAEDSTCAKMSLALCILKSKVVSVVAMIDLYLSGSGDGKSLCRSSMSFDFSHFYILLIINFFLLGEKLWGITSF